MKRGGPHKGQSLWETREYKNGGCADCQVLKKGEKALTGERQKKRKTKLVHFRPLQKRVQNEPFTRLIFAICGKGGGGEIPSINLKCNLAWAKKTGKKSTERRAADHPPRTKPASPPEVEEGK